MEKGFRGLQTWQKAYALALEVYKATKDFPKDEQYGLTSQLRRSAVSVGANIAEGYERVNRREYARFLVIAKGSIGELETLLMLAKDLNYLVGEKYEFVEAERKEAARLLVGLLRSLKS